MNTYLCMFTSDYKCMYMYICKNIPDSTMTGPFLFLVLPFLYFVLFLPLSLGTGSSEESSEDDEGLARADNNSS